jgi:hypothetical protein
MKTTTHIAKCIAPEDIRTGDVVALLQITLEFPSFFWCGDWSAPLSPHEPVRIDCLPYVAGMPLKVRAVCLPFVFTKSPTGEPQALDVRQCRLVRLDARYGRVAWRSFKKACRKTR